MLPASEGKRFCILHQARPTVPARGGIVFAQPFAEEMNKSRRAVAVAARRLAEIGWSVLLIDLHGCGDSDGDFEHARWEGWQADLSSAVKHLDSRGIPVCALWGLRLGALLATSIVERLRPNTHLLLWQPVLNGKAFLTQFLRLKAFEDMSVESAQRSTTARLRAELASGSSVDIAGYTLHPALAASIDRAELVLPPSHRGEVFWLETGRENMVDLFPASAQRVAGLRQTGCAVTTRVVSGPSFWQTVEIEESPALVDATASLAELMQPDGCEKSA